MFGSRGRAAIFLALALLTIQGSTAGAEETAKFEKGAEIRVTVATDNFGEQHTQTVKGTLVEWDDATLTLIPRGSYVPVTIQRKYVIQLEHKVQEGKKSSSALIGLGAGAAFGAVLGYAGGDDPEGMMSMSAGGKAAAGAITFGLIGALVGALAGPGEQWEYVQLDSYQVSLGSMPNGETGLVFVRRF